MLRRTKQYAKKIMDATYSNEQWHPSFMIKTNEDGKLSDILIFPCAYHSEKLNVYLGEQTIHLSFDVEYGWMKIFKNVNDNPDKVIKDYTLTLKFLEDVESYNEQLISDFIIHCLNKAGFNELFSMYGGIKSSNLHAGLMRYFVRDHLGEMLEHVWVKDEAELKTKLENMGYDLSEINWEINNKYK